MAIVEQIQQMLVDLLGPFGPLILVGFLGLTLVLLTLPIMLKKEEDPLEKLKTGGRIKVKEDAGVPTAKLRQVQKKDKLEKYSNFLEPQNQEDYSAVKLKLLQAGYTSKNSVRMYHFAQFALGILGLMVGLLYAFGVADFSELTTQDRAMYIIGPGVGGYMFPKYWVTRRQASRQEEIVNGFPDSLDMMLVCIEAGQSLDQSIIRVSKEMRSGFPALAHEFEIVSYEMKAGKDKMAVFKDMAERCGVPDIASFVTVLIQSQQFGTSIADALKVYSSEMRDKRVMRAEEKANTLPTKMTLATMLLTVPPLLIILIGPSIYDIMTSFGGANSL